MLSNVFQSTLPVRGATDFAPEVRPESYISIHAPRAGSDLLPVQQQGQALPISIHAPRAGSDVPCGLPHGNEKHISIHAPRAGSDQAESLAAAVALGFQSTLPVRGAT